MTIDNETGYKINLMTLNNDFIYDMKDQPGWDEVSDDTEIRIDTDITFTTDNYEDVKKIFRMLRKAEVWEEVPEPSSISASGDGEIARIHWIKSTTVNDEHYVNIWVFLTVPIDKFPDDFKREGCGFEEVEIKGSESYMRIAYVCK